MILNQIIASSTIHSGWDIAEKTLALFGIIGIVVSIIRLWFAFKQVTWIANVRIQDFPLEYDEENAEKNPISLNLWNNELDMKSFGNTIIFKPIDCVIPRLEVVELDKCGEENRVVYIYRNITPDSPLCFRLVRSECIPRYKLKWYSDYGDFGEHFFSINGRNGITEVSGCLYNKTPISIARRVLGLK